MDPAKQLPRFLPLLLLLVFAAPADTSQHDKGAAHCLALNLYWEARSEGSDGMLAVGWVVLNRIKDPRYPNTICEVIYQGGEKPPCEWSWWCDGKSDHPRNPRAWALAQKLAQRLLRTPPPDPTRGALWFHGRMPQAPPWAKAHRRTVRIGQHIFYRDSPSPK